MKYTNDEVSTLLALAMLGGIAEAIKEEEEKALKESKEKVVHMADYVAEKEAKEDVEMDVLSFDDFLKAMAEEAEEAEKSEEVVAPTQEGHITISVEGFTLTGHKDDVLDVLTQLQTVFPMKG